MSDGSLSQDEIDALLQGSGGMDFDEESAGGDDLSEQQIRAFEGVVSGTVDSQGSNFSMLVNSPVSMDKPAVSASRRDRLFGELDEQLVQIKLDYTSGISGDHLYLLSTETALAIAGPMMGQDGVELNDAAVNALQEAISQIHGPVSTALGEAAGATIMTGAPQGRSIGRDELDLPTGSFAKVEYPVTIDGSQYRIIELFAADIVNAVARQASSGGAGAGQQSQAQQPQAQQSGAGGQAAGGLAAMMGGGESGGSDPMAEMFGGAAGGQSGGGPGVQSVQFPNLQGGQGSGEQGNISLLMDVYMEMTVELGRTRKLIKEILGMGEGTIIELDKLAGEPVDILVNHKLIAKGEVVVIDENFGVRVTEIVSPMERVSNMS